jgi:hypothetical protein
MKQVVEEDTIGRDMRRYVTQYGLTALLDRLGYVCLALSAQYEQDPVLKAMWQARAVSVSCLNSEVSRIPRD